MSLALFRSELRNAVREAQSDAGAASAAARRPAPTLQADVLRRVARGELGIEAALKALRLNP